jgi:hypothetical protein
MADLVKACHYDRTHRVFCRWFRPRRTKEISAANTIIPAVRVLEAGVSVFDIYAGNCTERRS